MTPLVCVHGFMGGSRQWQAQHEALSGRISVASVDLPGFGENAHLDPQAEIGGFADWVLDTLSAQGIARFHLMGHSMGGMIAQEMVTRAPDRVDRLVLYGTGATGMLPGRFEPIDISKRRAQEEGAQQTARRIAATWFLHRTSAPAYADCAAIAECARLPAIVSGLDAMRDWSGEAALEKVRSKTLVIWGDQDRTYPWRQTEQLWTSIHGASLAVIPSCAHAAHFERPHLFNQILLEFLSSG